MFDRKAYMVKYRSLPESKQRARERDRSIKRWKVRELDPAYKKYKSDVQKKLRWNRKQQIVNAYGGKCCCVGCGENRLEFLTIEHVNGGGQKHRKAIKGYGVYKEIIARGFPPEFSVLCFNCNCSKGFYGYCPHEREIR